MEPGWAERAGLRVFCGGIYGAGLRRAILRLKQCNDSEAASWLAGWLARHVRPLLEEQTIGAVTAVPTSARRRRWRGYCAPERVARELARQLGLPYHPVLECPGDPIARKQLRGLAGRRQVRARFTACTRAAGNWLLVDDVVTSGQTLREAVLALEAAGAQKVLPLAVARSEPYCLKTSGRASAGPGR